MTRSRVTRHSPLVTLTFVFVACLLVVPLNPNGVTMYVYPFETLTSPAMQAHIVEWFSPDFHRADLQPFAWLLLGTFASLALSRKRVSLTDLLLLLVFGYAALRSSRNITFLALVAAPILAANVWDFLQARGWGTGLNRNTLNPRGAIVLNWLILLLVLAASAARVFIVTADQRATERANFPAAAVDFLQAHDAGMPLYNWYNWGGYLIWRLYPDTRVFIDGRADVYGDAFIEEFLKVYRGNTDWHALLDRYGVRAVLIEPDAPLAVQLARDAAWKKVYEDKQAVVFEK